ncbi:50S ribosome-binding GTPase [Thermosipho ferrireducens]|uniref:50S ribosome-binding GTPase n=1 Tax=Thermosipho ferrireducens TaxID=2571116 RepID=A0ABX7S7K0_9BACT|nr:GTPase [Thermosipho ferrireducens]QTA38554.1 50S ribosome-binding GTPase [Thermosipho ferrireducens]
MKCKGCGVELQHVNPERPGYVPLEIMEKALEEEILCQRCYKIKHYGKLITPVNENFFMEQLSTVLKKFQNFLYIIDISDFEGTYREEIMEKISHKNVFYAVTKFDLLPKSVCAGEVQNWLKKRLNVSNDKIFLTSSKNGFGLRKLEKFLVSLNDDIVVLGVANVGKSSLISRFCEDSPTISPFPGTTLGIVKRKIKGSRTYFYDTPGIITNDRVLDMLSPECQAKILATRELSRKTYKINASQSILVSAYCCLRVEYNTEKLPIFQIFAPAGVKFHLTKSEKTNKLILERNGEVLVPPCKKTNLDGMRWKEQRINLDEEKELVISGLAWINVKRGPFTMIVKVPENISIHIRDKLINPKRKGGKNR